MHDGSITFSTALDNTKLEKELASLTKKIEKQEQKIADLNSKRDKAKEKSLFDGAALDAEKAKLQEIKDRLAEIRTVAKDKSYSLGAREGAKADIPIVQQELKDQQVRVNALQAEWNKTENAVDRYTAQLNEAEGALDRQKAEAGELVQQIEKANSGAAQIVRAAGKAGDSMARLTERVKKLASRVFVFTLITTALRGMRTWMGKVIKTNDEARQSIAQLKGALLTLAQPLMEVIIPAFTLLVNVLTRVVTAVAQLVSALFGKTLKQSKDGAKALYNEANALEGVGSAAKEAAGSLAGFDEINAINTEDAAGGGGAATADILPDFSWADDMDSMLNRLKEIADLIGLIAAGLALWKIGSMLPGVLGQIAQLLGGILMTVGGLLLFWNGLTDAWENGVDWLNLIEMIGGLAAAAFGLYTIFELLHPGWGKIAAGIALVVGGIAMLVTGFHDAMENGWSLQNALLSIAGIIATGLGISLLTGSWIPLLIAGIAAVLLALTIATGHGEELLDGIREVIEGFKDFFVGVFTGDMEKAVDGIGKIFDGLKKTVFAVIDGIKDSFLSFLNWLDEKTGGKFHGIIETAKGFITAFYDNMKETLGGWVDGIKTVFQGLITFLTGVFTNDWDMAWEGVKNIFKGVWNANISLLEGAVNLIIRGLNWLISQMNKIHFDVPEWVPLVGGKSFGINIPPISETQIPRLAQGAVIPPNREFMAVLGDQRNGTNLEAPENLIRKIVREESGGGNGQVVMLLQALLEAVKAGQIIMVDKAVLGRIARDGIDDITKKSGKFALLF